MEQVIENRGYTGSGRFRRDGLFRPPPGLSQVATLLRGFEDSQLRLLSMMEHPSAEEQLATLFCPDFGSWGGFKKDLYRIGADLAGNSGGVAVLPRACRVFGKDYPRATTILFAKEPGGDTFLVFNSKDPNTGQFDIATGWAENPKRKDGPSRSLVQEILLPRTVVHVNTIESLFIPSLQRISA